MSEASIGVVVIGRNEGERLRACLASLQDVAARVYVDSGSTDGSVALARTLNFDVVDLDLTKPFTAARARNTGIAWLLEHHPALELMQVVDGDCEVRDGWLQTASEELRSEPRRAVVFGRRRERRPDANAYHVACDDEWNVPLGDVHSCGGDALFRVAALREAGGYNDALIAGEEPDLCLRLRERGWQIWSNGREMTWHDVAIDRLGQWWKRSLRAGFAFTELVDLHGARADPAWRRLVNSALGWTAVNVAALVSLVVLLLARNPIVRVAAAVLPVLVIVQMIRMTRSKRARYGMRRALQWALLMMVAKAAQTRGWLQYQSQRVTRRRATLIEYKA